MLKQIKLFLISLIIYTLTAGFNSAQSMQNIAINADIEVSVKPVSDAYSQKHINDGNMKSIWAAVNPVKDPIVITMHLQQIYNISKIILTPVEVAFYEPWKELLFRFDNNQEINKICSENGIQEFLFTNINARIIEIHIMSTYRKARFVGCHQIGIFGSETLSKTENRDSRLLHADSRKVKQNIREQIPSDTGDMITCACHDIIFGDMESGGPEVPKGWTCWVGSGAIALSLDDGLFYSGAKSLLIENKETKYPSRGSAFTPRVPVQKGDSLRISFYYACRDFDTRVSDTVISLLQYRDGKLVLDPQRTFFWDYYCDVGNTNWTFVEEVIPIDGDIDQIAVSFGLHTARSKLHIDDVCVEVLPFSAKILHSVIHSGKISCEISLSNATDEKLEFTGCLDVDMCGSHTSSGTKSYFTAPEGSKNITFEFSAAKICVENTAVLILTDKNDKRIWRYPLGNIPMAEFTFDNVWYRNYIFPGQKVIDITVNAQRHSDG